MESNFFTLTRHGLTPVTRLIKCGSTELCQTHVKRSVQDCQPDCRTPAAKVADLSSLNENGFVQGAGEVFHAKKGTEEMNGPHYEKWFTETLLPLLPSGSVIIMYNAPYHSMKQEKVLLMSSLKKNIRHWLSIKGVSRSIDIVKRTS